METVESTKVTESPNTVTVTGSVKPGPKTSEFFITMLPWLGFFGILVLIGLGAVDFQDVANVLLGLAGAGGYGVGKYAESRGIVKAGRE